MRDANPVGRVVGFVVGPPVRWVGRRVERRVRRAAPDLPEPPAWLGAVAVGGGMLTMLALELAQSRERSRSERAEPEAKPEVERGTTSDGDGGQEPVREALEALEVAPPPEPTEEDVRAAYRRRTLETHPDQGGDAEEFIEVREAWEVVTERQELSDGRVEGEVTQES